MNFESYAERINTLCKIDSEHTHKKLVQKRLQVKNAEMKMTSVNKVQFSSLSDKRYYISDEIVSLPFGHPLLSELRELKKPYSRIHIVIEKEKGKLLKLENPSCCKK